MKKTIIAALSLLLLLSAAGCSKSAPSQENVQPSDNSAESTTAEESSEVSAESKENVSSADESIESSVETDAESDDKEKNPLGINDDIQTIETYKYDDLSGLTQVVLLMYNKTDINCQVDCVITLSNEDGVVYDEQHYTMPAFEADTVEPVTFSYDSKCKNVEYTIKAVEPKDNVVFLSKKLTIDSVDEQPADKLATIKVTNESDIPADARLTVLFFKNYDVVYHKTVSVGEDEELFAPGDTKELKVKCPLDYDYTRVELYGYGTKE